MTACSCIKGVFGFYIKAIDTKKLIFKDASDWMTEEDNYSLPVSYTINVTPPGTGKQTTFTIIVASNNVLSWGENKLIDGLYCVETDSCGVHYTRSIGIFPNIECCIKQAWATLPAEYRSRIEEVESYLKMASTNAELNNVKTATQNLKIAQRLLENLKCDCSC